MSTLRYAAFLEKHRSELQQASTVQQQSSSRPRKLKQRASNDVQIVGNAEHELSPVDDQRELDDATYKQPALPNPLPTATTIFNSRKRPAASDGRPSEDIYRPGSPAKFSRTSNARAVPANIEPRPVYEQLAAVSLSDSPARQYSQQASSAVQNQATALPVRDHRGYGGYDSVPRQPFSLFRAESAHDHAASTFPSKVNEVAPDFEKIRRRGIGPQPISPLADESPIGADSDNDDGDGEGDTELPVNVGLVPQPICNPLTPEDLAAEVDAIYSNLVLIEAKCKNILKDVSNSIAQIGGNVQLAKKDWLSLTYLHKSLIYEHVDFLMASQLQSASETVRQFARERKMPARIWRYAIWGLLELMRAQLPSSLEMMLSFINFAYQHLTLLLETFPSFEDVWIECLGDLSRYRQGIEEEDQAEIELWARVACYWWSKASDRNPENGRLYHHIATMARTETTQQLCYFSKSLSAVQVWPDARKGLMNLLGPILARSISPGSRPLTVEQWFMRCHALIVTSATPEVTEESMQKFTTQLSGHITNMKSRWRLQGAKMAVTNIAAMLAYGSETNPLRQAFLKGEDERRGPLTIPTWTGHLFSRTARVQSQPAWNLTFLTLHSALTSQLLEDVLPHIHVMLVFIWRLSATSESTSCVNEAIWLAIAKYLNSTQSARLDYSKIEANIFPSPQAGEHHQLPEDYLIRGLVWSQDYFPSDWFEGAPDEQFRNDESFAGMSLRLVRVLWLGVQIASRSEFLHYNTATKRFHANQRFIPSSSDTSLNIEPAAHG